MSTQCRKCGVDLHPGLCGACERDELRAEVKRLTKALDVCSSVHAHNVKLHEERERLREALRDVAGRQREACRLRLRAKANDIMDDGGDRKVAMALCLAADRVAATPLVTED